MKIAFNTKHNHDLGRLLRLLNDDQFNEFALKIEPTILKLSQKLINQGLRLFSCDYYDKLYCEIESTIHDFYIAKYITTLKQSKLLYITYSLGQLKQIENFFISHIHHDLDICEGTISNFNDPNDNFLQPFKTRLWSLEQVYKDELSRQSEIYLLSERLQKSSPEFKMTILALILSALSILISIVIPFVQSLLNKAVDVRLINTCFK